MGKITNGEISMCRTVASFLRKDALIYEANEIATAAPRSVTDDIVGRGSEEITPTVTFRTIAMSAGLFCVSAMTCVLLMYSLISDRWVVIEGVGETALDFRSQGLRYSCDGASCVLTPYGNLSVCGRSESAVSSRFQTSLGLLIISFALFCVSGIAGAFLTKRFTDLRWILKVLRHSPQHFLQPIRYHTEHPALYRERVYESVAVDDNGIPLLPGEKRKPPPASDDVEMRRVGGMELRVFADLWASDSDDERSKSGERFRSPDAQHRRSLKRKELKIRLAAMNIANIEDEARTALRFVFVSLFSAWIAWLFAIIGTALFHGTAASWLNCGQSICDVITDGKCAYGPGFATAITGTLGASFCVLFCVLASAFGMADLYACLSATMELSRLHEAQIRIVQQAALSSLGRTQFSPAY